jgi:hypothetical protein
LPGESHYFSTIGATGRNVAKQAGTEQLDAPSTHAERLRRVYGEIVGLDALVHMLNYPSASALRRAHARGTLPIALHRIPGRRGLFALTGEVAAWLDRLSAEMKTEDP